MPRSSKRPDYVIVGAGTAGCAIAARLSEDPGVTVALLEAGSRYLRPLDVPLIGLWLWMRFPRLCAWDHATTAQAHLDGRAIPWPSGRLVGGSSSINAMIYHRGHAQSFDRWAELGNPGWGFRDLLPYFRTSEHCERGASAFHGTGGPVGVSDGRFRSELSLAFLDACDELGIVRNPDFNGPIQEGAGFHQVNQRGGRRAGAATAYLLPALHRPNLRVTTGATVTRILFDGTRARGVEYRRGGRRHEVSAEREIILCAGTVKSPHLLMLSGVGPADHLRRADILVTLDAPGVGSNLQDHLRVPVVYRVAGGAPDRAWRLARAGLRYLAAGRGLLTSNVSEATAIVRTDPGRPIPDAQIMLQWRAPREASRSSMSLEVSLLDPDSRGAVTIVSNDPDIAPLIHPNYLAADADAGTLMGGVELARRIATASPWRRHRLSETPWIGRPADRAATRAHVRRTATTGYHPVGTCRMGQDPLAVVSPELAVHGISGLRIADASVMPRIVTGGTHAAVIAIAEKAADLIRGRRPLGAQPGAHEPLDPAP